VVFIGYIWGHHYLESLNHRKEARRALFGENSQHRLVVGLFDENPSPVTYVSNKTLYDFYRIGVELLRKRPDIVVVAKPKRMEGVPEVSAVQELISPYVESGRFIIWDRLRADVTHLIAVSDAVVSMDMGVPYLEAVCCQTMGMNYAPSRNVSSPIYARAKGTLVFDNVEGVLAALEQALDHPDRKPWDGLEALLDDLDPYRDFRGMERMRGYIQQLDSPELQRDPSAPVTIVGH